MITATDTRCKSLRSLRLASWLTCPEVFAALLVSCRPPTRPPGTIVVLTESPIGRLDPRFALGAEVGIAVEVRAFEFATLMQDLRRQNFQLFSLQMTNVYEPDWLRSTYHSSRIPSEENGWSGLNRFHFSDLGLDRLLEQAAGSLDTGVRRELCGQRQRQVAEALPCFPLWHEHNLLVTRQELMSVGTPRTGGLEVFHDASVGAIR